MASPSYSFIDIAVLDAVRGGFAAGDALVILSRDLERVVWANGPGAKLLGFRSIEAVIGAPSGLPPAVRRQVTAAGVFADDAGERPVAIRLGGGFRSRLAMLRARAIALPDGETALLLIEQAVSRQESNAAETSGVAISGFSAEGQFAAIIDATGKPLAASPGFETLGIADDTLEDLVRMADRQPRRPVKRRIGGERGALPAGLARLTDDPATHLLIVVDEPETEIVADTTDPREAVGEVPAPTLPSREGEDARTEMEIRPSHAPAIPAAQTATPAASEAPSPDSHAGPIRFVWRMDAESRFMMISEEFTSAVGAPAADIIGRRFDEVATVFGLDADGEITALMERRDTWSGRTVLWPLAGQALRVPVDLAALPAYDRDHVFQGFRGFGMLRPGEAVDDPEKTGLALVPGQGPEPEETAAAAGAAPDAAASVEEDEDAAAAAPDEPSSEPAQPPLGEKVVRLAEHRPPTGDETPTQRRGGLSRTEQSAFREIAERLRRDSSTHRAQQNAASEKGEKPDRDDGRSPENEAAGGEPAYNEPVDRSDVTSTDPVGVDDAPPPTGAAEDDHAGKEEPEAAGGPEAPTVAAAPASADVTFLPSAFSGTTRASQQTEGVDPAILSHLPIPVLVHSGDVLHFANADFLQLTGYAGLDALAAAGGLDAIFAEQPDDADGHGTEARKLRLCTAHGEEFPVEAHLQSIRWREGKALLLALRRCRPQAVTQTEAGRDSETLRLRLEETRAIIDTATDGVVIIDNDGTIRTISRPAEALFGFDSSDVSGKPFSALFAIESQRAAQDYLEGLADNGVASVLNDGREVIGREAQGRFIPLFMTIGRLPNESGFCAVVRDITQWKRAEEELTEARSRAEHSSSQKTEFLARVSHEIRTPLNAIIGFSELMMDEKFGPIGSDRYRDYLRDINRSGNHVLDLVNDLLDISKIEAGEQEMNYEAVSLNDTLGEAVAMMQPQANRERVIIRSSFSSRLPEVVADLRSIKQIALNLLSNAVRYTPAGGQVIVSTSYEAAGAVVMRVRDTGNGMSPEELDQALKPFKQLNTLRRTRGDGTGLGLPLTRAMVEANRARFSIRSTPGEGTLVEVTFPPTRVLAD